MAKPPQHREQGWTQDPAWMGHSEAPCTLPPFQLAPPQPGGCQGVEAPGKDQAYSLRRPHQPQSLRVKVVKHQLTVRLLPTEMLWGGGRRKDPRCNWVLLGSCLAGTSPSVKTDPAQPGGLTGPSAPHPASLPAPSSHSKSSLVVPTSSSCSNSAKCPSAPRKGLAPNLTSYHPAPMPPHPAQHL